MRSSADFKLIDNFIACVNRDNIHKHVIKTVDELLYEVSLVPIIIEKDTFIKVLLGYLEHIEEYELCAQIVKNTDNIKNRLIPAPKFSTKNHELFKALTNGTF